MQEQFFSVTHATPVNVIPMPADFHLPSLEELDAELPEPFRISSAITSIDLVTTRLLRNQNESMHDLIEIVNQQSRKIDMIMGYVLSLQDHPEQRFHTLRFGAGQLTYLHPYHGHGDAPHLHQIVRLKIFLREEAAAIYCYGQSNSSTAVNMAPMCSSTMCGSAKMTVNCWFVPASTCNQSSSSCAPKNVSANQSERRDR